MKRNIIFLCILTSVTCRVIAQSKPVTVDTMGWGRVQDNYPGGQDAYNKYVSNNAKYPNIAFENRIMGCTYIRFIIEKDGSLTDIQIYKSIGSGMDEAAVRLLQNSGTWVPSKANGIPIRSKCIVPVNYVLTESGNNTLKGLINGNPPDSAFLLKAIAAESVTVPLSDISNHIGNYIKFVGKIYGTKAISDTVFILTCNQLVYSPKYVNIVLIGKKAQIDDSKKKLSGYQIQGNGRVINYNDTPIIVIYDRKQYNLTSSLKEGY